MKKDGFLQISFSWLFAFIVGGFILFLAIYAAVKMINTSETEIDARIGKEIGILLNPLEISFESEKTTSLTTPVTTRIINKCYPSGIFGEQVIQIQQKSFNKWTNTNIDIGFSNKYIFSERQTEGKKFYVFLKPFEFPFKVADLIFLSSADKNYCFVDAPEQIKNKLTDLSQKNIFNEDDLKNCPESSIKVCFGTGNCNIKINQNANYVEKQNKRLYFETDALMYAAIFAEPEIYECQVKRLMQRTSELAILYKDKATFIARTGCNSNLDLVSLSTLASGLEQSSQLTSLFQIVNKIGENNNDADCKLW
ncbi:MAG: hypothetical protein KKF48_04770 [Nanoarchaeota archaeon]|nr:hypothetical protein [Nanoarchaeota archaeon]MBU1028330.1 hypothetical protein [Nanoarchaeota archaeon]